MSRPVLLAVTGAPGSGKTTLARELGRALGWPVVCRDEVKMGMVWNAGDYRPGPGDPYAWPTLEAFSDVLGVLVRAGVSVVAEAAFQEPLWSRVLEPLGDTLDLRLIRCAVDREIAVQRVVARMDADPSRRVAHTDAQYLAEAPPFTPVALPVPTLDVDTTDSYRPPLADLVRFATDVKP